MATHNDRIIVDGGSPAHLLELVGDRRSEGWQPDGKPTEEGDSRGNKRFYQAMERPRRQAATPVPPAAGASAEAGV